MGAIQIAGLQTLDADPSTDETAPTLDGNIHAGKIEEVERHLLFVTSVPGYPRMEERLRSIGCIRI